MLRKAFLKRIFRAQKDGTLNNDSLYAEVWYRGAELDNRANIDAALNKAGVDTSKGLPAQDPYWAETELGVITAKFPRPDLQRSQEQDRISWSVAIHAPGATRTIFPAPPFCTNACAWAAS
jgi:hypothetical protein